MLASLKIENVAVIESAAVEFGCGLNVITGETAVYDMGYRSAAIDLEIADSKDNAVTLSYKNVSYSITGDNEYSEAGITFDRTTKEFK